MEIQELASVGGKTTMRIGGKARYFATMQTRADVEEAVRIATEKRIPLILLGSGSNTVFNDGVTEALVARIGNASVTVEGNPASAASSAGRRVTVGAGANLAMLVNDLATQGLDLSPLTGIPGTVGGAIFGNAGQGPKGTWMDSYVTDVTVYMAGGWKTFTKQECGFGYRESSFKHWTKNMDKWLIMPVIWEVTMTVPSGEPTAIQAEVQRLLQVRIDTQPHLKTAGSCFKAVGDTPAWKLIDAAGLRGTQIGGVQIAEKHANFLLNKGDATYADAKAIVEKVRATISEPLDVEMRFIETDGSLAF
jgi:UDP-N-acetylmuramate dehydrogenase